MSNKSEEEALKQAASAAKNLIADLEKEKRKIDAKIKSLSAIVDASDIFFEKTPITETPVHVKSSSEVHFEVRPKKRTPRGEIEYNIDRILEGGAEYDEHEIRRLIHERYSADYNRSTVNSALNRLKNKKYEKRGSLWRIIITPEETNNTDNGHLEDEEKESPLAVN